MHQPVTPAQPACVMPPPSCLLWQWCGGQSVVFMAAGREDMDVRMLGKGRPFLLQVRSSRAGIITICRTTTASGKSLALVVIPLFHTPLVLIVFCLVLAGYGVRQVNDPRRVPSSAQQVAALEASVNREEGLNAEGDVVISQLEMSEKSEVRHAGRQRRSDC